MAQTTMYPAQVNSPETTLNGGITNVATSITVTDASVLPSAPNLLTIGDGDIAETILMTNKVGNNLTVTRGVQGDAIAWDAGTPIRRMFTAYDHDTFKANIEDLDSNKADSDHLHGNITNDGKIGNTTGLMVKTTTNGVLTTLAQGSSGQYLKYDGTWDTPPDTTEVSNDTTPQLSGELDQNGHTIGGVEYDNGNSGTSKTIDWKNGNHQKVTMTGNCTFTFTAPSKACMLSLRFINDGTAGRVRTLPTIKWPGGTAPTWTTTANAVDILSLFYDGSAYYGQAGLAFS
jgi:hypothetical protein